MSESIKYCESLTRYQRLKTRVVHIGDVPIGGEYPIRVQSMTTTDTMDTKATVEQSIRMIEAGSEYVRITAPSIREARNLMEIKSKLRKQGYTTPLIANLHQRCKTIMDAFQFIFVGLIRILNFLKFFTIGNGISTNLRGL